jgi:PPOX class probable F420-dependent enzyme
MTANLTEAAKALLRQPVLAHVATISASGEPRVTPVWVDEDGGDVLINSAEGRVKSVDLHRNPVVAVSVVDPADNYRVIALRGRAVEMTHDGADAHIDFLAHKYLGVDSYPMRREGEQRVKIRIRPEHISMQPADAS